MRLSRGNIKIWVTAWSIRWRMGRSIRLRRGKLEVRIGGLMLVLDSSWIKAIIRAFQIHTAGSRDSSQNKIQIRQKSICSMKIISTATWRRSESGTNNNLSIKTLRLQKNPNNPDPTLSPHIPQKPQLFTTSLAPYPNKSHHKSSKGISSWPLTAGKPKKRSLSKLTSLQKFIPHQMLTPMMTRLKTMKNQTHFLKFAKSDSPTLLRTSFSKWFVNLPGTSPTFSKSHLTKNALNRKWRKTLRRSDRTKSIMMKINCLRFPIKPKPLRP